MMADLEYCEVESSLRREYGSTSSIDALSSVNGENSFFSLLKKYPKENIIDQRSPGPPNMQEYLRGRRGAPSMAHTNSPPLAGSNNCGSMGNNNNVFSSVTNSASSNCLVSSSMALEEAAQSPRVRNKFQKLWEGKSEKSSKSKGKLSDENGGSSSIFRKLRSSNSKPEGGNDQQSATSSNARLDDPEVRFEEKLRKKAFAHYDSQSITANLHYASRLCHVLTKRRNTTTGASAASCGKSSDEEIDSGDNRSNELVLSCPYFRNELGGEEERVICLNRTTNRRPSANENPSAVFLHRPSMSCGLALLEDANDRRWRLKSCPYQKSTNDKCFIIEDFDIGATYYREHFFGLEHQNWFGIDENLGPIAISIRKERVVTSMLNSHENDSSGHNQTKHQYRLIIRTSELSVLRGTVYEECIPSLSSSKHNHNNHHAKEVLEYITPEISLNSLRLGVSTADEQLLKLDEQLIARTYKVGVLYSKSGQGTEEEMYNNEHSSPAFEEFLTCLGERVRLKGFDKYRAGLDSKTDTTGLFSVYANYNDCEIMFHVSTMLPYTPNNRQQLLRKRHIGNDIVTIVFQEPDALPFTPKTIRSHFQHVFIIVRVLPGTRNGVPTRYAVAVSRSKEVPVFGPPIPKKGLFTKSKAFTEFLLSKVINAENAAHRSEKFRSMAQRTRHEYLKDLAQNQVTNTTVSDVSCGSSAGAKLVSSIFGSSKKSKSNRVGRDSRFIGDSVVKGGIMWEMCVEDYGQSKLIDCLVAVSSDTFVIIEEATKEIIFATPNFSILGWISDTSSIKLFYHQGECILLKCKDPDLDEIRELVVRLKAVTGGCETQELTLRRNSLGQLGFHVGDGGVVTDVEKTAFVWQAGLRKNARIVEICKVAIATLDHEQMIDLLKTSMTVTITVLPAKPDGSPRRGCPLHNCSYLTPVALNTLVGDYENVGNMLDRSGLPDWKKPRSCTPQNHSLKSAAMHSHIVASPSIGPPVLSDISRGASTPTTPLYSNIAPPRTYNATPTSIYNTPKKDLKCATVSGSKMPPRGAHDHNVVQHVGNLVVSRSELSLANRKSPAVTNIAMSSIPLHHSRSHSHHLVRQTRNFSVPSTVRQSVIADGANRPTLDYHSDTSSSNEWCSNTWSLPVSQRPLEGDSTSYGLGTLSSVKDRVTQSKSPKLYNRPLRANMVEKAKIKNGSNKSSGSSCSGSSTSTSTLQEDLLKLINPEYISDPIENEGNSSSGGETSTTQYSTAYSFLERSANKDSADKSCDVILTVAQPAQVISSEPSSPADFHKDKENFLMSQSFAGCSLNPVPSNADQQTNIPLADEEGDIDWPSLVDTTNRAVSVSQRTDNFQKVPKDALDEWLKEFGSSLSSNNVEDLNPEAVKELENTVRQLQSDLMKEQTDKETLAQQVRRLQQENQRLHEESQTAAAQLRRFTEWFFQNMNAK